MAKLQLVPADSQLALDPNGVYVQTGGRFGAVLRTGRRHRTGRRSWYYRGDWQSLDIMSVWDQNRRYFTSSAILWRQTFSAARKLAWKNWAAANPITTEPYSPKNLTAYGAYMFFAKTAMPFVYGRGDLNTSPPPPPPLLDPPVAYNPPVLPPSNIIARAFSPAEQLFGQVLSGPIPPGPNVRVLVYMGRPVTGGRIYPLPLVQGSEGGQLNQFGNALLYFNFPPIFGRLLLGESVNFGIRPFDAVHFVPGALTRFLLIVGPSNALP